MTQVLIWLETFLRTSSLSCPNPVMGTHLFTPQSVGALILAIALLYITRRRTAKRLPLPPSPTGLPILGNIFNVPSKEEWKAYQTWGTQFGSDIIYLNMAGTPMIVLNSREASHDLLDRRSSVYSDRPRYVMLNELSGFGWDFNFQSYGKEWKERRKLFTREMQPPKSLQHRNIEAMAVRGLLKRLVSTADDFVNHLRHMAGEIILSIAYGIDILPENDPHIQLSEAGLVAIVKAASWGSYAVDYLPILKYLPSWIPGLHFKKDAERWRKLARDMVTKPFESVETLMISGTATPSVASSSLEAMDENDLDSKLVLKDTLGAMYEAGADTTVSALSTFFLAMVLYPDVQKRGQSEVNRVIGSSRLPTFSDDKSIPYVDAILKEVLRWRPVAPLALPHRLVVDDTYKGYALPAGSVVVGNTWAMLQDTDTYGDDVDVFRPERFMRGRDLDPRVPHPDPAFGFGRRSCPGQDIAWSSMWLTIASVLASFEITKAEDAEGNIIEPSGKYTSGMQIYPEPFLCNIRLRSSELMPLVMENA